jgi:hypothetical protein
MRVETVTIIGENGESLIINKSDYDPASHDLWVGLEGVSTPEPEPEEEEPEPETEEDEDEDSEE